VVDPGTGRVSAEQKSVGRSWVKRGYGEVSVAGSGGSLTAKGWGLNGFGMPPFQINYEFGLSVSKSGGVSLNGGAHDGFPSFEIWVYRDGTAPERLYYHKEGHIGQLAGSKDTKVP
jgi:hypothetical protein